MISFEYARELAVAAVVSAIGLAIFAAWPR